MESTDALEHRIDDLEEWEATKIALEKESATRQALRHTRFQIGLSAFSAVSVIINLYTLFLSHK